ncbi:MAG: TGS domain-containing protein [Candidatus Lokiarchaeota archaeon]|nr:TGS domain-containing protein [Candidatus Lokiarchaeota archaeon]
MSSNIGPEAQAAYQKYLDAESLEEQIKHLEEFISLIPKHKATENIVALNKSKLAKLRRQLDKNNQKSISKVVSPFSIKKEGIQIILISDYHTPGVGKTSLLNFLTNAAKSKIGSFNALPEIGILNYQNIRYQIVDMPSIMKDASKGVGNGKEIISQIRSCDLICMCVDLSRSIEEQIELLLYELNNADIKINEPLPTINIEKTGSNNIQVLFLTKESKENMDLTDKIKKIIQENGIQNCIVKLNGKITLDQIVDRLNPSIVYKKAIIIGTKGDLPHTEERFEILKSKFSQDFKLIASSIHKKNFPPNFGELVLNLLNKIRVYTMNSGKVAERPLILDKGAIIKDVAHKIHRSFVELFDFAIVMRKNARQNRKKVGLEYSIIDNDIIEIHTM